MLKIAMIPIDNRPVCYGIPTDINLFCNDIDLYLPPRELLGDLKTCAQSEKILDWLEALDSFDILVVALDTIAYGGLVPSRRSSESELEIIQKINRLKSIINKNKAKTYACSSIMRISNNNINEEEKEYWSLWGKKIFDYSFNLHKSQKTKSYDSNAKFSCIRQVIPTEILEDYFATRKRNFEINKIYLDWQKEGILDLLVFSKDDCAQYGVNVSEAEKLQEIIIENNLNALVKTGADEIPLTLLVRSFCDAQKLHPRIYPQFLRPEQTDIISKYEDISIKESTDAQISLCGALTCQSQEEADIVLIINNFETEQGELVMNIDTKLFDKELKVPNKPYILADVAFANGADINFVKAFFAQTINWNNFLGYAGWNTSANTLGSALCMGIFKFLSNTNKENFKQSQFIRFADDWAYQAICRKELKSLISEPNIEKISELMSPYIDEIKRKFEINISRTNYTFPWKRFFEIEIMPE